MDNSYSAKVRGSGVILPRGGISMILAWYAAACLIVVLAIGPPLGFAVTYLAILALLAAGTVYLRATATYPAFAADSDGIWLGRDMMRAPRKQVAWQQIRQLSIARTKYGALLEAVLVSSADPVQPARPAGPLANTARMLIPSGYDRRSYTPDLLAPLADPPRYRIPLAGVTPEQLRFALGSLAPATLPIEVSG